MFKVSLTAFVTFLISIAAFAQEAAKKPTMLESIFQFLINLKAETK